MKITICPTCERETLIKVCEDYTVKVGSGVKRFPNVPRLRCTSCGEELFDRESNRVIDQYRGRRNRRRPSDRP